jgi:hypothetical protein
MPNPTSVGAISMPVLRSRRSMVHFANSASHHLIALTARISIEYGTQGAQAIGHIVEKCCIRRNDQSSRLTSRCRDAPLRRSSLRAARSVQV